MKASSPAVLCRFASACIATLLAAGCATRPPLPPPPIQAHCPAKFSDHYVDTVHRFSLCLPAGLSKGDAGAYPSGTVLFTGFAVPAGTNLEAKQLIIVPGTDPDMQGATPDGRLTADGVTFSRVQAGEGSAGHLTQYYIYTWTHGGKTLHFDFSLYSSNVNDYPPASRPAEFDLPAQVKFTREIMKTFRLLH